MKQLRNIADYVSEKVKVANADKRYYISTDNMLPNKEGITETVSFPESGSATQYRKDDVLVSNIRPYFKKIWYAANDGSCSNDVLVFRPKDSNQTDSKFLYYLLAQDIFFEHMMAGANGTKMPRGNKKLIPNFEIPDYDLPTQKRIASILSAYDDLIEVNRKQIKLLEEAAERLYREWFIDLRFPGHETATFNADGLPEGWERKILGEIIGYEIGGGWGSDTQETASSKPAYVIRGTDFHCVTDGSMSTIPYRFHAESNLKSRMLQDGDIIFEVSGGSKTEGAARTVFITSTLLQQLNAPAMCASFCKLVRAKERSLAIYLYDTFQYLRKTDQTRKYDKYSAGNIVNYRWQDFLNQQIIVVPGNIVLNKYNEIAENLYERIQTLARQISQAQTARDLLLPRLMNGEIQL